MSKVNMALVKINYIELALPVSDACKLIGLLEKAQKYEENYVYDDEGKNGKYVRYLGGELPNIGMSILESERYAEALANGVKPKKD